MSIVATLLQVGVALPPSEKVPTPEVVAAGVPAGEVVAIRDIAERYGMSWDWAVKVTDELVARGVLERAITTGARRGRAGVRQAPEKRKPEVSLTHLKNANRAQLIAYLKDVGRVPRQVLSHATTSELRQRAYAVLHSRREQMGERDAVE